MRAIGLVSGQAERLNRCVEDGAIMYPRGISMLAMSASTITAKTASLLVEKDVELDRMRRCA
ncbi:hypothetical protein EH32_03910 [Erythrobacter litoralis]|uniref:Uncharacterized protein n=1 Tax=Erythrobacter litoralis TaxID=39960 RepID=A0A074MBQ6_9SPHN|nr:hypothetical protein EH32_03910 [Erythrobacter litoralis]